MPDFETIVRRYRPRGYRLMLSSRRNKIADEGALNSARIRPCRLPLKTVAVTDPNTKVIYAPYARCPYSLQILLHEYGHVHLKHWGIGAGPLHKEEFEADRWAMEIMRIEGVPVPKSVIRSSRRYLEVCIDRDQRNGIAILPHIKRWAES